MPFGVQYGHAPLPKESEIEKVWEKRARKYQVIVGYAKEETTFFMSYIETLSPVFKLPILSHLIKPLFIKFSTQKIYAKGAHEFFNLFQSAGGKILLYELRFGSKTNGYGATHTIDLPLLFWVENTWGKGLLVKDIPKHEIRRYGKELRKLFCTFASKGLPSSQSSLVDLRITV